MKRYFILLTLLTIEFCFAQVPGEKYYNKEIGWTIQLPAGYKNVSPEEIQEHEQRGLNMVEGAVGMDLENIVEPVTTLFMLGQGGFNSFEANLQAFDPAIDGDFDEINNGFADIILQTFQNQFPGVKIDMDINDEIIDGNKFMVAKYVLYIQETTHLHMHMYTTLLGKQSLTVSIVYVEDESGKILLDALKNSKFN